jgi:hypothetical protein
MTTRTPGLQWNPFAEYYARKRRLLDGRPTETDEPEKVQTNPDHPSGYMADRDKGKQSPGHPKLTMDWMIRRPAG